MTTPDIEKLRELASEMLAALTALYEACERRANEEGGDFGDDIGPAAELADAAIAKAALLDSPPPNLPPSLAVKPNIAWEHQTIEQLEAERDYWIARVADASGFASAKAADDFRRGCERWIEIHRAALSKTERGGER